LERSKESSRRAGLFLLQLLGSNNGFLGHNHSGFGGSLSGHGELGASVLAKHLGGKLGLVTEEELVVVSSDFGTTGDTHKVPEKSRDGCIVR
jgi:hypothetical protein